jgi:4-aminobutyrate aminotransferase-like enzyme
MFNLKVRKIKKINTKNRIIKGSFPSKTLLKCVKQIDKYQNSDILGQQPVLWKRAKNFSIYDSNNNKWIDFSSSIFVANVGHGNEKIISTIKKNADRLLHAYSYPTHERAKYLKKLIKFIPSYLNSATLLNSGTEAAERAIKISRLYGLNFKKNKKIIVGYFGNYHGKTLGSAMLSGETKDTHWVGYRDPNMFRLKFPYPWLINSKKSAKDFFQEHKKILSTKRLNNKICAIFLESYQGYGAIFYPKDYLKELYSWCKKKKILIVFDEIQAGFGRTGKLFGYQHYGVKPDLVICGKGISSSLPLSAVLGKKKLLDLDRNYTSTHGGHPLCCAAAEANLDEIKRMKLINRSKILGKILFKEVNNWKKKIPGLIPHIDGKGLVCGIFFSKTNNPEDLDVKFVNLVVEKCLERGVFNLATNRGTLKIAPPLTITKSALLEGLEVIYKTIKELYYEKK